MTREELKGLLSPRWLEAERERRGAEGIMKMMHEMARTIERMAEGQYIAVDKVKEENRELFYVVACDAMMCNNKFYFNDDYTRFYRARTDADGNAIIAV